MRESLGTRLTTDDMLKRVKGESQSLNLYVLSKGSSSSSSRSSECLEKLAFFVALILTSATCSLVAKLRESWAQDFAESLQHATT